MKIKNGPREKLIEQGIKSLSDVELLAIIIKNGTKNESVLEISKKIIDEIGDIKHLNDYNYNELLSFNGIGPVKAMEILSIIELSKRIVMEKTNIKTIKTPVDFMKIIKDDLYNSPVEKVVAIYLDSSCKILSKNIMFEGVYNKSIIDIREIIKRAIKLNASYVGIAHNHPTGNLTPSKEDYKTTSKLKDALNEFSIELFDSIIVSNLQFYSIKNGYHGNL